MRPRLTQCLLLEALVSQPPVERGGPGEQYGRDISNSSLQGGGGVGGGGGGVGGGGGEEEGEGEGEGEVGGNKSTIIMGVLFSEGLLCLPLVQTLILIPS